MIAASTDTVDKCPVVTHCVTVCGEAMMCKANRDSNLGV